ncbi:hypothetical protein NQ317_004764 [Molorchus minor]|uniref:DUF5641 domain-containing protein n=1 Tax=Molorchus minor TaxID=1323400 RepID=A0ABQ9JF95_9CUCU|nr:hypothetical protein NQ317_004764 [Molorchus minor]
MLYTILLNSSGFYGDNNDSSHWQDFAFNKDIIIIIIIDIPENRLIRWQRAQFLAQHYWKRWSNEYLSELQRRVKWKVHAAKVINLGDLVLIKNDNAPSVIWPLGRIVTLRAGKDGVTRVVDSKVPNGEITRLVSKICVLPIDI